MRTITITLAAGLFATLPAAAQSPAKHWEVAA